MFPVTVVDETLLNRCTIAAGHFVAISLLKARFVCSENSRYTATAAVMFVKLISDDWSHGPRAEFYAL